MTRLWKCSRPARYFIVPDAIPWPDGADEVRDVRGRPRWVRLAALEVFEVDGDEVRRWCRGERERSAAASLVRSVVDLDVAPMVEALRGLGLDLERLLGDAPGTARLIDEIVAAFGAAPGGDAPALFERLAAAMADHGEAATRLREPVALAREDRP